MSNQLQLENTLYRQWVKAGLGLGILKEGLAPFCQDIANQQHKDMLDSIQQKKSLPSNKTCVTCQLRTLKADHVKIGNKVCPYGQANCNCLFPNGKNPCPSSICSTIYDYIIKSHASTPPAPTWRNTNSQLWTVDSWSIAKCYINAPGYERTKSAVDTDSAGLLHVIINNKYFHNHIACNVTGSSIFKTVRSYRNDIFHSSSMELDEATANSYIDDMISILQDSKELVYKPYAQHAVRKLQDLKNKDFKITSESFEELLKQIAESNKEGFEGIKRKLSYIETQILEQNEEIKRLREEEPAEQKQLEYEKAKAEWRSKMIQEYYNSVLKVPAMPLVPDDTCEFSKIYVMPNIVSEVKDENRETKETEIKSMSNIFTRNGVPLKFIYVVGDAGTGKSSFCKYLVNCWCMAHSEEQIADDGFDGVNEMKKFEFLFFISLRHNQNIDSIREMLSNQYDIDILGTLLEKDSAKMIILLDGLDEWSSGCKTYNQFQTMGLPKHDVYKGYTLVTTSRPWKIHTLRISDKEIHQLLKLKGFDDKSESEMIERTISNINFRKKEGKKIYDCRRKLGQESLRNLKAVPIMLQQLVCLWFDGKLEKTSRCVVYTEMLELFFTWNEYKTRKNFVNIEGSQAVELPEYIANKEICEVNRNLIYDMSQLAFQTLFNCPKDMSLTFDISVFRKLKISDEVRKDCLKLGILTEDRCPILSVSERPKPMFSFLHKSVQEYLAAVNIAINFEIKINSSGRLQKEDLEQVDTKFVHDFFKTCSTVNEILEQSNVVSMLCGLEPRLATGVSRYIYDIVKDDPLVQRYRRTIDSDNVYSSDYSCILDIQNLIFDSTKECNACFVENSPKFDLGDLIVDDRNEFCEIVCSSINQRQTPPDLVLSVTVENINTINVTFSKYLLKFKNLEKIKISYEYVPQRLLSTANVEHMIDEVNIYIAETIKINAYTLKSLSLIGIVSTDRLNSLYKSVVLVLPSMHNLVAIEMTSITMSHVETTKFCDFLKDTSHLEQIHIDINCECRKQHDIDLSNHQQLQYLYLRGIMCVTDIDTANLEVFTCWNIKRTYCVKIFDSIRKCDKLKELLLYVDDNKKSQLFHTSITKRLVSVLPLLNNLNILELHKLRLTDNIVQVPLKSLKSINLYNVTMSLATWRNFIDNLLSISHPVDMTFFQSYITGDGEEFNDDDMFVDGEEFNDDMLPLVLGGKVNDAREYVKDQKQLFHVKRDDSFWFIFSTIKKI